MVMPEEFWNGRSTRKRFSEEEKRNLLEEQGGKCMYCGCDGLKLGIGNMEVDHKVPWGKGGSDRKSNLQVLCHECNKRKTGKKDQRFRKDFESIGVPQTQSPPAQPIPQSKFRERAKQIAAEKAKRAQARRRRDDDLPTWPS